MRNFTAQVPGLREHELQREQQIDKYVDSFIHTVPPHLRMALRTATAGMDVSRLNLEGVLAALAHRQWRIGWLLQEYTHTTGAEESYRKESRDIEELKSVLPGAHPDRNEA